MMAASTASSTTAATASGSAVRHPDVLWAQRANLVLLSIEVHDCKNPKFKLEKNKVIFEAQGQGIATGTDTKLYRAELDLYAPIDPEKSSYHIGARLVTLNLAKADTDAPWWPRLLADKRKPSWLKVDFARWKDEDEEDEEDQQKGMPGTMDMSGGMGFNGGFNPSQFNFADMPELGGDSDDEEMPGLGDEEEEEEEADKDSMEVVD